MKTKSFKILLLIGIVTSLTACGGGALPNLTVGDGGNSSQTPLARSSNTPRPSFTATTAPPPAPPVVGATQPIPRAFAYLGDKDTLALGFDMRAGGAIGSLLYYGHEMINHKDFGRYVQLSFYAGNQEYTSTAEDAFGNWGWNPVQAGSKDYHGAKVLEYRTSPHEIYIKAYGKEWGQSNANADVIFETWAWQRGTYFEVHVRATHIGADTHAAHEQEFPAAYFASWLAKASGYFGDSPFTAQPITEPAASDPQACSDATPTENWVAFANRAGLGLILALPPQTYLTSHWRLCLLSQVPPTVGYTAPIAVFDNPPNAIRDVTFYLIPGEVNKGRAIVYDVVPHTTWTFDLGSSEGWLARAATVRVRSGVLTTRLSARDFLTYAGLHVTGRVVPDVTIRARAKGADAHLCLSYLTASDGYWDLSRDNTSCLLLRAGDFQTSTFQFGGKALVPGDEITQYRLRATEPSQIEIDNMAVAANGLAP